MIRHESTPIALLLTVLFAPLAWSGGAGAGGADSSSASGVRTESRAGPAEVPFASGEHTERPNDAKLAKTEVSRLAVGSEDGLLFDETPDGVVYARGGKYKAFFTPDAATFVPFFGSEAAENHPVTFRASGATVAGEPLTCDASARVRRDERLVRMDRGTFVEEYVLDEAHLEQRFVFDALARRGDLVLRVEVETGLTPKECGASLRFSNDLGHVDYGGAFAIDASGARIALERGFDGSAITLTVPATFVESAVLPLTIDPLVSAFAVAQGSLQKASPDVFHDDISGRYCVVYEDVFSATDHDVTAKLFDSSGVLQAILSIDATSDDWTGVRVANVRNVNRFLVVAAVDPAPVASNTSSIRGRLVNAVGATLGATFQISPQDATDRDAPDVGGDAFNGVNAHFCVVWQRRVSSSISQIEMQMVTQAGALQGSATVLNGNTGLNTRPAVSNSDGLVGTNGLLAERWTVAWEFEMTPTNHDIHARQVAWNGATLTPTFIVDSSSSDERDPDVGSLLDPIAGQRFGLVVYQRDNGVDEDILGRLLSGSTVLATRNLSADHAPSASYRQLSPTVDSDGRHFLVGFVEIWPPFPVPDVWVSDYFVSGGVLQPWSVHQIVAATLDAESEIALCSNYSSAGSRRRFSAVWTRSASTTKAIEGAFWDGGVGGVASAFCTGDGDGTPCPCGNVGASGLGCANSATAGARLSGVNTASVSADTFVLQGTSMPASSVCLYFQGTSKAAFGAGIVFGDGKLCVNGTVVRLGLRTNSAGASQLPDGSGPTLSALGLVPAEGATRYYQVWYRDAAAFCSGSTFNLTNALEIVWSP